MPQIATGTFNVTLTPTSLEDATDASLGRMVMTKHFQGDLDATSQGEMLTAGTPEAGSAAYVAIEKISGTLQGRHGSFVLQHSAIMTRGVPTQTITVVPDSGTEDLTGLAGNITIIITGDQHQYEFTYSLDERDTSPTL